MTVHVNLRGRLKDRDRIRVMGFDVGKANPAWSVVEIRRDSDKPRIIEAQMAKRKINSFHHSEKLNPKGDSATSRVTKSNFGQVMDFGVQVRAIVEKYQIDYAVVERFQNRGFGKTGGEASEFCGLIVGVIAANLVNNSIPYFLIPASTWKTQFNNQANLGLLSSDSEKVPLKALYKLANFPDHIVDSVLMAIYGGMHLYEKVPFKNFQYEWVGKLLK